MTITGGRRDRSGRNDPCWCRSGRKFKRCHGNPIEPDVLMWDASSQRMFRILGPVPRERFLPEWLEDVEELAARVLSAFNKGDIVPSAEASELLQKWLREIEDRLAALARRESRQLGLHLVRRIKPTANPYGVNETTAGLARTTLDLAIQKYGKRDGRPFVIAQPSSQELRDWISGPDDAHLPAADDTPGGVLLPVQLTYEDALWAYRMEAVAYSFAHVAAQLRRAWKGGWLVIDGSASSVGLDSDTEELVQQFDRRARTYNGALSAFGLIADLDDMDRVRAQPLWSVFVPIPNWKNVDTSKLAGMTTTFAYQSNFIVMPLTLEPWYECASLFADEIERATGASPRDIVLTLGAATQRHYALATQKVLYVPNLWDRGYWVINDRAEFTGDLAAWVRRLHVDLFDSGISEADAVAMVTRGIAALSQPEQGLAGVDVWARTGARPIFPLGGQWLFDYTLIPIALGDILESLAIAGGDAGGRKGDAFERQAETIVSAEIPGARVWQAPRELEFPDNTKRELDRGFVVDSRMYVAECKSLLVPAAHDRGDPGALAKRREQIAYAIGKAETLAAKLARYPIGKNYELPADVLELVPCALSPFTEYMPQRAERFFLDTKYEWPRAMVPREFADALQTVGAGKLTFGTAPLKRGGESPT